MSSLLKSTLNTRALPVAEMRYIRSDAPLLLAEEEIQWLLNNNITTLIDLRSGEELERKPCPLKDIEGFTYYHLPVTGGGEVPKSREHLHETYCGMVDGQMKVILDTILGASSNVMYFCTAGKDRTGVVSALLLKKLGVDVEVIVEDYMKSKENLLDMLTEYVQIHPEVDIDIIIPQEENIRKILALEKITLCGDNCIECPRYNAHTDEELYAVAELWHRVGWRDRIVTNEEIKCSGCHSHKQCTYQLVDCTREHGVEKCNQCSFFPCDKISQMLMRSQEYQRVCKKVCTSSEYEKLNEAFFDKENNLRK